MKIYLQDNVPLNQFATFLLHEFVMVKLLKGGVSPNNNVDWVGRKQF